MGILSSNRHTFFSSLGLLIVIVAINSLQNSGTTDICFLSGLKQAWNVVLLKDIHTTMDYILEEVQEITIPKVIKWISSTVMIFGGVAPFIPQYREIKKKNDAEGFSLYVCLVLLIANILRILFWFGKRYELPLLAQSMIMNVMMLLMIHLCVRVKNRGQIIRGADRVFTDFDFKYFWAWTDFQSYIDFILIVSLVMSLVTFLLLESVIYVEILGFMALFTEAMLAMPQLIRNFKQKSTEGMSILMVLMWTVGDIFKTTYFVLREAPAQFWLCGGLQVLIDITILGQVQFYKSRTPVARHVHHHDPRTDD